MKIAAADLSATFCNVKFTPAIALLQIPTKPPRSSRPVHESPPLTLDFPQI
jgi:hypothetical protein